jgi:integrase
MSQQQRGTGRVFQSVYTDPKTRERKRTRTWWITYSLRGREHRESCGSTNRAVAVQLLKKRLGEIGRGQFIGPVAERTTLDEVLQMLLVDYELNQRRSLPGAKLIVAHLKATLGPEMRVIDLTLDRIARYTQERLADGLAPGTVNRNLAILRRALRLGHRAGKVAAVPPISLLREQNARQGFIEWGEFQTVLTFLRPDDLRDLALFAYLTAWRRGECLSLTWADVDREGRTIRLRPEHAKTGHGRTLALEGELWGLIERRWAARRITMPSGETKLMDLVFHRQGRPFRSFRSAWAKACEKAGVPGRLFHDLRRSAIRNMVRGGVPERVAMAISGHKTRAIFDRYNITSEKDVREAVLRTEAYLTSQPAQPVVRRLQESSSS